ncbi:hypothetical protein [uncultured Aquimarina sp.]|uniref:leucine-rich repeat domain-containing protein n=1 Tax=uncultured Aquimarina sp. TaxID=575652 RepID=UPI002613FC9D|nr:hypothetical protein [uncultured Aquimarina sp.]
MKIYTYKIKYFFTLILLWVSVVSFAQVSQAERDALIDLYNATDGPNWRNTLAGDRAWQINDPNSDVSTWYGVKVLEGRISEIDLQLNNLTGSLTSSIGIFTSLKQLKLSLNQITGIIPEEIGNLVSLEGLGITHNQLSGSIPLQLGNLKSLVGLHLHHNQLVGTIPGSLGNLPVLKALYLNNNNLTGSIPVELSKLILLNSLSLSFNQLTGVIPVEFTQLSSLNIVYLNNNQLSGKVPDFTTQFNSLIPFFHINDNTFKFSDFETEFITYINKLGDNFIYFPQSKVDTEETVSVTEGGTITLTSDVLTSNNNNYQWYKKINGTLIPITGATSKDFTINGVTEADAGEYIFKATNSVVTNLELERNPITLTVTPGIDCVSAAERQALVDLYNATNGDNWTNTIAVNQPWLVNDPNSSVCDWYGIVVGDGKVTQINLPVNNLSGSIPSSINKLTGLRAIYLGSNDFSGSTLPVEMGQLTELRSIRINNCKFEGDFPVQLTGLTELIILRAEKNNFTGPLPPEIGQLKKLQVLDLHQNQLSGEIPTEIGEMINLTYLRLFSNQLTGQLPSSLGDLINLGTLTLGGNPFASTLPKELGQLKKLAFLSLNNCGLYGEIPPEISGMMSLRTMSMYNNRFTGSIPRSFEQLNNLENIALQGNELSGSIPEELGLVQGLKTIVLYSNQLTGNIPVSLGQLSNLTTLRLEANQLSGSIPASFVQLSNLKRLNLHSNNLEGKLDSGLAELVSLENFTIYNNKFIFSDFETEFSQYDSRLGTNFRYNPQADVDMEETLSVIEGGSITLTSNVLTSDNNNYQWFKNDIAIEAASKKDLVISNATSSNTGEYIFRATNSIVRDLELKRNPITLTVTPSNDCVSALERQALIDFYVATNGDNWANTVAGNQPWLINDPNSSVCDWYGVNVSEGKVVDLILSSNDLSGAIPATIENLSGLKRIMLDRNQLTGSIPETISNLSQLNDIRLFTNQLEGSIPEMIGNLTLLNRFDVRYNQLGGNLPITFWELTNLEYCLLHNNQFTGPIPREVENLNKLITFDINTNQFSGELPKELGNLLSLELFRAYKNQFNGAIPMEIGLLKALKDLNIRDNQLTGPIPEQLATIPNLEVLSLSGNQLTGGVIKPALGQLSKLRVLNLGDNQLTGTIPTELGELIELTHLQLYKNQLEGSIPKEITNLEALRELYLYQNYFEGKIPDFTQNLALTTLLIRQNKFIFSDFENEFKAYNDTLGDKFSYAPQEEVDEIETITGNPGERIVLSTRLFSDNNNYQWYKDGVTITGATSREFSIENPSDADAGVYHFLATNTVVTNLELKRNPITVTISAGSLCNVSAEERQALIDFYMATDGDNWINTRQNNQPWLINDPNSLVCDWFGVVVVDGKVKELDLEANNLVGSIPEVITQLGTLEILKLPKNKLSGNIPAVIGQMTSLVTLRLNQNQLTGAVPPELGQLINLTGLQLYQNQLTGTIPVELFGLESILYLSLSRNQLTGTIPREFGQLKTMQQLHLAYNQLNGPIPEELYTLDRLAYLYLDHNSLTGNIPVPQVGQLPKLVRLWFNSNKLNGTVPGQFGQLPRLDQLWLDVNELSGTIPPELGQAQRITSLKLNTNQLTGDIPKELTQLSTVKVLYLFDNQLTGAIHSEFGDMTALTYFDISKNQLSGSIPATFGNLKNTKFINISVNKLTGTIPSEIGQSDMALQYFSANDNDLEGSIPTSFMNLDKLIRLNVGRNQLSGKIPDLSGITPLTALYIQYNEFIFSDFEKEFVKYKTQLETFQYSPQAKVDEEETRSVSIGEGPITLISNQLTSENNSYQWYKKVDETVTPIADATSKDFTLAEVKEEDAGDYYFLVTNTVVTELELERNPITLTINAGNPCNVSAEERQALIDFYLATDGDNWKNTLEGNKPWLINDPNSSVCDWFGVTVIDGSITVLNLPSNNLVGNISPKLEVLLNLENLTLRSNQLTGSIPVELENLIKLKRIDIGSNKLIGTIPIELFLKLKSLTYLSLRNNKLIGEIPPEIEELDKLGTLLLNGNQLSGTIPATIGKLVKLRDLYLNDNQLTGSVPAELGLLKDVLGNLALSNNQLSGAIPPEIGDLSKLVTLFLNQNELTGIIPQTFDQLGSLQILNLSNNLLSGRVPDLTSLPLRTTPVGGGSFAIQNNKFIFSDFEVEFDVYSPKLGNNFQYSPQAKVDIEETKIAVLGDLVKLTSNQLTSDNNSYQWYKKVGETVTPIADATSKDFTIAEVKEEDAGEYYFLATNSVVTGLELERNPITLEVSGALGEMIQYFCSSEYPIYEYPKVKDIISPILGEVDWYTEQFGGDLLNNQDPLGEYTLYWADNGFEARISVEVILDEGAPNIPDYQMFSRDANATIADLEAEDLSITWFATASGQQELSITEPLVNATVYYASLNGNSCRTAVFAFVGTLPPDGDGWQYFCLTQQARVSDLDLQGTDLKWYTSETGDETYDNNDLLVDGNVYYASQNDGVEESPSRKRVIVSMYDTPAPVGKSLQVVATNDQAYVSDLTASGSNIKWYDRPEGGNLLKETTIIEDGKTYYASQTRGICESISRLEVTVQIIPKEQPQLVDCIKFRPDPGKKYIVSAWVREDAVKAEPTEVIYFNNNSVGNSDVSKLFVDLLNDLLGKVMRQEGVPEVYEPDPEQRKYDPLVPFLKEKSSDNFAIYYLENIKDEYGLTVGFSFYLDPDKKTRFVFKTPYVRRANSYMGYRYPLIVNGSDQNSDDFVKITFTTAKPCGTDICVFYDLEVKITSNNIVNNTSFTEKNKLNYEEYNYNFAYQNSVKPIAETQLTTGIKSQLQRFRYVPNPDYQAIEYENALLKISFENNKDGGEAIPANEKNLFFKPLGPVIKGWQRVAAQFDIPEKATDMFVSLKNNNDNGIYAYFDDIRIYPFNGNMKSYVYDPVTQRLMAELDENNYATFYEYDKEGGLVRVKKETEEGVYTIQETRSGTYKKTSNPQ